MSCCFFAWASEGESEDDVARPVPNNEDMLETALSKFELIGQDEEAFQEEEKSSFATIDYTFESYREVFKAIE